MDDLLPRALPVLESASTETGADDGPAETALSYLKKVREEASKYPDVSIATNLDSDAFDSMKTYSVPYDGGSVKAPPGFEPSIQWQIKQILEFSKLREKLAKMRQTFQRSKTGAPKFPADLTDGQRWVVWCCGKGVLFDDSCDDDDDEDEEDDDAEANEDEDIFDDAKEDAANEEDSPESPEEDTDRQMAKSGVSGILKSLADPDSTPMPPNPSRESDLSKGNPPLLSVLMYMNQPLVEKVLRHHIEHMRGHGFHVQQGPWIFAFMALLQKPLTPDTCSVLRDLARLCSQFRSELDSPDHPHLQPFNLFVSLVSRYFDQRDLADGLDVLR